MMEHALLRAFINAPQRTLNREHLVQAMNSCYPQPRRDHSSIASQAEPGIIQTRRNEGYVFAVPVKSVY